MQSAIRTGSWAISDEWAATPPAAAMSGLHMEGQVQHETTFRNADSGVHSNDIESEFSRLKRWMVAKFMYYRMSSQLTEEGKRAHLERKLSEYLFYTNVGRKMSDVMLAIRHANRSAP